jgi:hypothetical protein
MIDEKMPTIRGIYTRFKFARNLNPVRKKKGSSVRNDRSDEEAKCIASLFRFLDEVHATIVLTVLQTPLGDRLVV